VWLKVVLPCWTDFEADFWRPCEVDFETPFVNARIGESIAGFKKNTAVTVMREMHVSMAQNKTTLVMALRIELILGICI